MTELSQLVQVAPPRRLEPLGRRGGLVGTGTGTVGARVGGSVGSGN